MATGIIRLDEGWRLDEGHHLDSAPNVPGQIATTVLPTKRKPGTKTMDYIPRLRPARYLWWKTIRDTIETEGPKVGLTVAEITAIKATATDQCAKMEAADAADNAAKGAKTSEKEATRVNQLAIRAAVRNIKTRAAYPGSGVEGTLGLKGAESTFDPSTFKTVLTLTVLGNQVKVDFTKGECDCVAVYARLRGTLGWTKLGLDSESPYYDTRPLASPGTPEVREYMARGVINDEEIGIESDIVSVAFGG